ncbi:hypothetical protein HY572_00425 [Candidatus Micrarchaeota archaeon]|nr:hypothetical protein [Candidatus Micrarchaeota archaeon]
MQLPEAIWKRRLESECAEMRAAGIRFDVTPDLTTYTVSIQGPGLAQQNGSIVPRSQHSVRIELNRDYPYPGGLMAFWLTPIFHPNIHPGVGVVCIQLVNEWSEGQNLVSVVNGLIQLLKNPNPQSPLNEEAARYYLEHQDLPQHKPKGPRVVGL